MTNLPSNKNTFEFRHHPIIYKIDKFPINKIEECAFQLIQRFKRLNINVRIMGGWCRDVVLGRRLYANDIDIFSYDITIEKLKEILDGLGYLYDQSSYLVNNGVFQLIDPAGKSYHIDVSIARYIDPHRPKKFMYPKNLAEDIISRDCTANSLIFDIDTGNIHDPCNALKDFKERKITTMMPNLNHLYRNNPLIFFRILKFSVLFEYELDESILLAINHFNDRGYRRAQLSNGSAIKLIKNMSDDQFIQFIDVIKQSNLLWFFKPRSRNEYITRERHIEENNNKLYYDYIYMNKQNYNSEFPPLLVSQH